MDKATTAQAAAIKAAAIKAAAIKDTYEERKREHESNFQREVEALVYEIEEKSNRLRGLKARLTELEYEEPEKLGGILTSDIQEI